MVKRFIYIYCSRLEEITNETKKAINVKNRTTNDKTEMAVNMSSKLLTFKTELNNQANKPEVMQIIIAYFIILANIN